MGGVEHTSTSAPVPCVDSKPADSEPSGTATSGTTGNMSQGSLDQPAPLRCGIHATQNQLPWRYWNFTLLADTSPPGILDCVGWSMFLSPFHIMPVHHFHGKYSVNTLYLYHPISAKHHSLLALKEIPSI